MVTLQTIPSKIRSPTRHDSTNATNAFRFLIKFSAGKALYFRHSQGLGVVLLDPNAPHLAHLATLARDPDMQSFYRHIVRDVAEGMPSRMRVSGLRRAAAPDITPRGKLIDELIPAKIRKPSRLRKALRKVRGQ